MLQFASLSSIIGKAELIPQRKAELIPQRNDKCLGHNDQGWHEDKSQFAVKGM